MAIIVTAGCVVLASMALLNGDAIAFALFSLASFLALRAQGRG